jgi:SLA1 homology domain 1, SHD1
MDPLGGRGSASLGGEEYEAGQSRQLKAGGLVKTGKPGWVSSQRITNTTKSLIKVSFFKINLHVNIFLIYINKNVDNSQGSDNIHAVAAGKCLPLEVHLIPKREVSMLVKNLGTLVLGLVFVLAGTSVASAGTYGYCTPVCCPPVCCPPVCCPPVCCPPVCCLPTVCITSVTIEPIRVTPVHPPTVHGGDAMRQVRVTYFSTKYNAWFETDAVVAPKDATIGLSVDVNVPNVGHVRGWVVTVYTQPRMQSPYKMETQEAVKSPGTGVSSKAATTVQALVSASAEINRLAGCTRLWTNKDGQKHVVAELVKVNRDSVTVRLKDGKVAVQPFANLSEADIEFVQSSSGTSPRATQVN